MMHFVKFRVYIAMQGSVERGGCDPCSGGCWEIYKLSKYNLSARFRASVCTVFSFIYFSLSGEIFEIRVT